MRFENTLAIIALVWVMPFMFFFWVFAIRTRRILCERFIDSPLLHDMSLSYSQVRYYIKISMISIALVLIFLALAQPQWGFKWRRIRQEGVDIVIAVDTSKSMLAEDLRPNRLERTKIAIRNVINRLRGNRIGLVVFAGRAFIGCPLTLDYSGFIRSLDSLDINTIPRGGTSLSEAIEESIRCFEPGEKKYRVMILISDGENHEGDAIKAAEQAKAERIRIFCIGVGTERGSYVPTDGNISKGRYIKDAYGQRVKTRLNEKLLKKIAAITGGAYLRSTTTQFGLQEIYDRKIAVMEKRQIKGRLQKDYFERFQLPLALAIILLCAEMVISTRRGRL